MPPGDDDGRYHHDRVQRIRQRHKRSVEQWRNTLDNFKPHEAREDEDIEIRNEIRWHECSFAFVQCAVANEGSLKNSRTRAFTISPPLVISVSRTISSCRFICRLPSFTM